MNKKKREKLSYALRLIEEAECIVDSILESEQDSLDNLPDSFACSDMYEKIENAVESLDSTYSALGDAINSIQEAIS